VASDSVAPLVTDTAPVSPLTDSTLPIFATAVGKSVIWLAVCVCVVPALPSNAVCKPEIALMAGVA
jgi:hypothetical protein